MKRTKKKPAGISIKSEFRGLKSGTSIPLKLQELNYWVGPNGSGKTTATAILLTALNKKKGVVPKYLWNALLVNEVSCVTGVESITGVSVASDKLRQSQFVDLGVTIEMGIHRLHSSEGQNAQLDIVEAFKYKDDKNHLVILDEADGRLDYRTKLLLHTQLLPKFNCTVIVVSHDPIFLADKHVFDFSDCTEKLGEKYYQEQENGLLSHFGKENNKSENIKV